MALPPDRPHRRDMRLPGWDYRLPGPYAITICTEHRWHLFGQVTEAWGQLADAFPTVLFDAWVLMPNHLHALVRLPGTEVRLGDLVQGSRG